MIIALRDPLRTKINFFLMAPTNTYSVIDAFLFYNLQDRKKEEKPLISKINKKVQLGTETKNS